MRLNSPSPSKSTPSTKSTPTHLIHHPGDRILVQRGMMTSSCASGVDQPQENDDHDAAESASDGNEITPHLERLLRLIRDGSPDVVDAAIDELYHSCRNQKTAILQWRILGRLQSTLCGSQSWRTRTQTAHALERIAHLVPRQDQDLFFRQKSSSIQSDKANVGDDPQNIFLKVERMEQPKFWIDLKKRSRRLYATAASKWERDEQAYERDLLKELSHKKGDSGGSDMVVQRRITWQRQKLAQRLGLNALVVTQQDTRYLEANSHPPDGDDGSNGKEGRSRKRRRTTKADEQGNSDETENRETSNLQDLLVTEMQRAVASSPPDHQRDCSQLNPQQLLATEFLYNMLHTSWMVRHGALLGLQALVRAWRESLHTASADQKSVWPQDLLVRSITILVFDRFGDFSGAFTVPAVGPESSGEKDQPVLSQLGQSSSDYHGGCVAPIRECAAQLVALLFTLMKRPHRTKQANTATSTQIRILDVLEHRLLNGLSDDEEDVSEAWEIRHGALIALKYISALLWHDVERRMAITKQEPYATKNNGNSTPEEVEGLQLQPLLCRLTRLAVIHLADSSDDVVCVAAQLLREMVKSAGRSSLVSVDLCSIAKSSGVVSALWTALQRVQSFSSCIPDLVGLLAEILDSLPEFGHELAETQPLDEIFSLLSNFLDSDYESVQFSALKSMACISSLLGSLCKSGVTNDFALTTCDKIMKRLFLLHINTKSPRSASTNHQLGETWRRLCGVLSGIMQLDNDKKRAFDALERDLLLLFFDRLLSRASSDYFKLIETGCNLLVSFSRRTEDFPSRGLLLIMASMLQSPWTAQCEASCVLFRSFATLSNGRIGQFDSMTPALRSIISDEPLCIQLEKRLGNENPRLREPSVIRLCNEGIARGFEKLQEVSIETALENVIALWKEVIQVHLPMGTDIKSTSGVPVEVVIMRLRATVSGAVLAHEVPSKITPYVRSLMSSLKSETSTTRLRQTFQTIAMLLKALEKSAQHSKASTKIFKTLVDAAVNESRGRSRTDCQAACEGLRMVTTTMDVGLLSDRSHPLWNWLSSFSAQDATDESLFSAIHLVWVLCFRAPSETPLVRFLATNFLSDLTRICITHSNAEMQKTASSTIRCICSTSSTDELHLALDSTVKLMEANRGDEKVRIQCCLLLGTVADVSGTRFRPFVRSLFPIVMKLMRDCNTECSARATSLFSLLVQLAPLVRLEKSIAVGGTGVNSHTSHVKDVIDHLILGKAIPPCQFPEHISSLLLQSGVVLRSYQEEGISWVHFLQSVNLNGALTDSMGLGKTLQALLSIALAHDRGSPESASLVVCPSTLVGHWMAETNRFFPGDSVFRPMAIVGSASARKQQWQSIEKGMNLVIVPYSVLRSDIEEIEKVEFCCCVLDEGHLLRNPKTATARASRRIKVDHKLILSGTIIQNRVDDLWAVFDYLMPNFLGSSSEFWKNYGRPISKSQASDASADEINKGCERLKDLHQRVLPFILRREKEQVLKELPPKNVIVVPCRMSNTQSKIYQSFRASSKMKNSIAELQRALENSAGKTSFGSAVLKTLFFLRLLCTHPSLVTPASDEETENASKAQLQDSGKLLALVDILHMTGISDDIITAADNDTSLLYSADDGDHKTDSYKSIVNSSSVAPLSNMASTQRPKEGHSKCLIFAQFSQSLDAVERLILQERMSSTGYLRLDGKVAPSRRHEVAEKFNSDADIRILLLTTRVGSLGLNLTGADTVIFLEHDWNPFVDLQAMDRAHRLGQAKTVTVYRLVMADTIEERIMSIQRKKTEMNDAVVNSDNSSLYSMGTDRLLDIFTVENGATEGAENDDFDLDGLLERYREDYASALSVSNFLQKVSTKASSAE